MMFVAAFAALIALAEPAAPPPTADQPQVTSDQPATAIAPAVEPAVPTVSTRQSPAPTAPLVPPLPPATPLPTPSAETVEEMAPAPPPSPPPVRPTAGFGFEMGYAHGGDRFFTIGGPTRIPVSANAGDGVFFSLAGNWTPYWSERGVGLGLYARAGAKYVAIGDSTTSASFLRCPLAVGVQVLLPTWGRWFAIGRLGVLTEVLGQLAVADNGGSRSSTDFSSGLGEFIDAGMYWAASGTTGIAAIARYERLDVSYNGDTMSANNLGALAAAYLRF